MAKKLGKHGKADGATSKDAENAQLPMPPAFEAVSTPALPSGGYTPSFQPMDAKAVAHKRRKRRKIIAIAAGSVVGLILIAYLVGVFVFMGRFFPHTSIADMDISGKTPAEVSQILDDKLGDYNFTVKGHGFDLTLNGAEMGLTLDSESIAAGLLSQMNPWAWPYEVFQNHDDTESLASTYQDTKLADTIKAEVKKINKQGTKPKNATIAFNEQTHVYNIVPEKEGTTLDLEEVLAQVTDATLDFQPVVELTDEVLARPKIKATDDVVQVAQAEANKLLEGKVELTINGDVAGTIDAKTIADHIKVTKKLNVKLDLEPLVEWARELANSFDTVGATRTYKTKDGKKVTVKGGDYGWVTDSEATAKKVKKALKSGEATVVEIVMRQEAAQAPDKGGRDWGKRYVDVDLSKQHAKFYGENGKVIWESDFVSGLPVDGRATPEGVYYIKSNDGASTLVGLKPDGTKDYETKVSYWMPFIGNSIGFHDASWQPSFGGERWQVGGSHGCVNLPVGKAQELHEVIEVGDVVVVHS